jgi:hypothetical protein
LFLDHLTDKENYLFYGCLKRIPPSLHSNKKPSLFPPCFVKWGIFFLGQINQIRIDQHRIASNRAAELADVMNAVGIPDWDDVVFDVVQLERYQEVPDLWI